MKCALIIPAWSPEEIFPAKTAGSQINYWQPLGTLYVASALLKAGHEVRFLNGAFMPHEEILKAIEEYRPDFAGLYSTAFGWGKAVRTASDIKRLLKDVFVCAGGPYPTAVGAQCLREAEDMDAVVLGEGEITVVEILSRLSGDFGLDGIEGTAFREGKGIVTPSPRSLVSDLDSLPFPERGLLGETGLYVPPPATYRRKPVAVVMTSRGCNRRCIFCFQMDKDRASGIRYRGIGNVLEEIELCLRQGYREIKFIDDTLAADYDRAMQLAREIKSRRFDFTWFASACVNQVDKPLLKAFKDAGCWAILFGAESGVQKNLNALKKGTTVEQIRRAVRDAKEAGLKVLTPFIFGIPGETYAEALETIEFACEINPDIANFHCLTPFPGSELYDNVEKYGTLSEDLNDYTYQGAAFVPYTMNREEIVELRRTAFKRFYSRPEFLIKRALGLRTTDDLAAAFNGLRSLFWVWTQKGLFSRKERRC
ncbi:MAG: radical SAM protein [Nitrospirae bacterium]|nr:MAG: radical SAM protein [Nitrospirota bacterium]